MILNLLLRDSMSKYAIDTETEQCCLGYVKVTLTNGNCSENNNKFACILRIRRVGSVYLHANMAGS